MSTVTARPSLRSRVTVTFAALALLTSLHTLTGALPAEAAAAPLPTVKPERVGLSAERLKRIDELTRRYVDEGKLAGVVTLIARHGKVAYFDAVGKANLETGAPMQKDTLVRIYSMSKPITAVAAMMLYEEGRFQLSDPISKFLPELAELEVLTADGQRVPAKPITMQHLLTHTAGFSYGFGPNDPVDKLYRESNLLQARDLDEFVARLAELPLKFQPGEQWHYSVAVDVTGAVVERISGQRFDRFLAERLFAPLGMDDTFFDIPDEKAARFGTNHRYDAKTGKLEVLPVPEYPLWKDTTFFSGGGGLVSTAEDYARFCQMLLNGGELDGQRILSPKTVEFMTMNHLPALLEATGAGERPGLIGSRSGSGFGLGFGVVTDVPQAGVVGSVGEYSWGGAAGTVFWIDPVEDLFVVSMIQLMQSPWPLRQELKVLTYQALTELNPAVGQ
ncbi:MAG TPA: serine hydrolase domain-containing protein [Pseudomonadales bacterium]